MRSSAGSSQIGDLVITQSKCVNNSITPRMSSVSAGNDTTDYIVTHSFIEYLLSI